MAAGHVRNVAIRERVIGGTMADWQLIATAPREEVLVWAYITGVFPEQWSIFVALAHGSDWWSRWGGMPLEPTHWMPLPPPPKDVT